MFSRYNIAPSSWRYTVLVLALTAALIIWAILQGNATGYILAVVLLVFVMPMVLVVFINRGALRRMETATMDQSERDTLIAQYKSGYDEVRTALQQLSEADLDNRPASGGWSPREIVHHLADSETMSTIRLRRLLAEERSTLASYDEELFARKLHYDRPIAASLEVLRAVRSSNSELLEWLSEDEWQREGTHSEQGRYTVEDWLRIYAAHAHDHAAQILQAQEA
jgi:DinB superfamily